PLLTLKATNCWLSWYSATDCAPLLSVRVWRKKAHKEPALMPCIRGWVLSKLPRQLVVKLVGPTVKGVYPPVIQRPSKPKGGPNQVKLSPTTMPPVSA